MYHISESVNIYLFVPIQYEKIGTKKWIIDTCAIYAYNITIAFM